MDIELIQKYVNNFRRRLAPLLKPDIGIRIDIYNCNLDGAVLIIYFLPGGKSVDNEIPGYNSISDVLSEINQNFVGGNLKGFTFKGTNIAMDPEKGNSHKR